MTDLQSLQKKNNALEARLDDIRMGMILADGARQFGYVAVLTERWQKISNERDVIVAEISEATKEMTWPQKMVALHSDDELARMGFDVAALREAA